MIISHFCVLLLFRFQCRLIVAQMSNTRCEAIHWMTPIYIISVAISLLMPFLERPIIYLLTIFTSLAHWHYGSKVVSHEEKGEEKKNIAKIIQYIYLFILICFVYSFSSTSSVLLGSTNVCTFQSAMLWCYTSC